MKLLKALGLALVGAAALMAMVDASSASATVICKNNLNTEKCSDPYPQGTKGTASLSQSMLLKTSGGTTIATCTESTVSGTLANEPSAATTAQSTLTSLTFGGCNTTVKTLVAGTGELHHIAGTDNGTLTTSGTEVTVNFLGLSCIFQLSKTDMGTTVGGNPGSLTLNATVPGISGFPCPSSGILSGKYVATEPKAAWVSAG